MNQTERDKNTVLELLLAWVDFKATHELQSTKINCCERTQRLFTALDSFEQIVRDL